MADVIELSDYTELPDLDTLSREELLDYLKSVRAQIDQLDSQEPKNMNSEAYEDWGGRHESLEDLADEIQDLLDEMGGSHG